MGTVSVCMKNKRKDSQMNKLMMIGVAASVLGLTGCITSAKNDGGEACLTPKIEKDIVHEKYSVEKNTITAAESLTYLSYGPFCFAWGGSATHVSSRAPVGEVKWYGLTPQQKALNGAFANACDQAGCDTLVGARYSYKDENYIFFGKVTCEASGYPAKLTGVELIPYQAK